MRFRCFALALSMVWLSATATAQSTGLLVPDETGSRVLLLDAQDGSVLDADFIDLTVPGALMPIEANQVDDEIWVTDREAGRIYRYGQFDQRFRGDAQVGLALPAGFSVASGRVWLAIRGAGTQLAEVTKGGVMIGPHTAQAPWDTFPFGGELLVTDTNLDRIERYAFDGSYIGLFQDSDNGPLSSKFHMQLAERTATGNLLATSFEPRFGIFEFAPDGTQVSSWTLSSGVHGVAELGDGNLLYTDADGIHVLDPATGNSSDILTGFSARSIGRLEALEIGDEECTGEPNSSGVGAQLDITGSDSLSANRFTLLASDIPGGRMALFYYGTTQVQAPLNSGVRCVGGSVGRLPVVQTGASGTLELRFDLSRMTLQPGDTLRFQAWYRDGSTANLSAARGVRFTP